MWEKVKFFTPNEFDSPDLKGSGERFMKSSTILKLDRARQLAKIPFHIRSGYRTPSHNKRVGGTPESSHITGYAVDIAVSTNLQRFKIVTALLSAGFTRIGIGKTFVHADDDPSKPEGVIWHYY